MIHLKIVKNPESTLSFKPDFYIEIIVLSLRIEFHFIIILPDIYWLILIFKALRICFELTHDSLIMPSNSFPDVLCILSYQIHWGRWVTDNLFVNMRHLNSILFFVICNYSLLNVMSIYYYFSRFHMT